METSTNQITDLTAVEVIDSLTGFEELVVQKRFDASINDLLLGTATTAKRALIFTLYARQDNGPKDPYKAAMGIKVGDLDSYFAEDEEDADEDGLPGGDGEPATVTGKDGQQPETTPTSSPTSVS